MIKNMIHFETKLGERIYSFSCSPDSPLGEIHDALHQMKSEVVRRINEIEKSEDQKTSDEKIEQFEEKNGIN